MANGVCHIGPSCQPNERKRRRFGKRHQRMAQRYASTIVPTTIRTAHMQNHALRRGQTLSYRLPSHHFRSQPQGSDAMCRWLNPRTRARFPGPTEERRLTIGMVWRNEFGDAFESARFRTFGGKQIVQSTSHRHFVAMQAAQSNGKGRSPVGHIHSGTRPTTTVRLLPGFDQRPGAKRCRIAMQGQGRPCGWFQPGLFAGKVSPATIGVLSCT